MMMSFALTFKYELGLSKFDDLGGSLTDLGKLTISDKTSHRNNYLHVYASMDDHLLHISNKETNKN